MKTFADLKIGDTVFNIYNNHIEKLIIKGLNGDYAIECEGGYSESTRKDVKWNDIKDKTSCDAYYRKIYCNMSEALMDLKQSYKERLDTKWNEVQKAMNEFIALKDEVYKYL